MNREELIQDYLHGRLTPEEKVAIELWMNEEADFKAEVAAQRDLQAAFSDLNKEKLRQQLKEYEQAYTAPKSIPVIRKIRKPQKWLPAAVVALLIGFGWAYFLNNRANPDKIFQAYFQVYPNIEAPIVRGESAESLQQKAFYAYSNGLYTQAITNFEALYQQTGQDYYLFYEANAFLALKKPKKAIPLLKKQVSYNDNYSPKSKWYLALAYVSIHQKNKAIRLLREIKTAKSFNYQKSSDLIDKLK